MLGKLIGINDVALGFGHLIHAEVEPRMREHALGERHIQSHQEDGPIDGVEAQNILADDMHVRGPVLAEMLALLLVSLIGIVSERRNIVGQRVQPDVNDVTGVEIHGNSPREGGAGNAQILKACLEEVVDHLLFAELGLDKFGMLLDVLHQAIRILAHLKEVCLLLCLRQRTAAVGALALDRLRCGKEGLTGRAIPALVLSLIDISLLVEALEDLLHGGDVIIVGRADKIVVAGGKRSPDIADLPRNAIHVRLRRHALLTCERFDLLTVLIRARAEENVLSAGALISCNRIGHDDLIGIAEVRLARCVGDGGRYVKFFIHAFVPPSISIHQSFVYSSKYNTGTCAAGCH